MVPTLASAGEKMGSSLSCRLGGTMSEPGMSLTLGIRGWFVDSAICGCKQWLHSRGVSNALALPWAKPWLQLCDVDCKGMRLLPTTWLTDGVGQDTAWKYFSNPASGYQSYSRVPANMPFATRRLNRMHRHCLENGLALSKHPSKTHGYLGSDSACICCRD